jgi:Holliday junction resolvase RusA-like endonuclease
MPRQNEGLPSGPSQKTPHWAELAGLPGNRMNYRPRHVSEEDFKVLENRVRGTAQRPAMTNWKDSPEANHGPTRKVSGSTLSPRHAPSPTFQTFDIAITGQLVSGKNRVRIRRDGHHYPEKHFINWRAKANLEVHSQLMRAPNIGVPIRLTCDYWPGDKRTRDVSGQLDALFYLLVYTKVIKSDGLVYEVAWRRHELNKKFPKVVMEIEAYV